MMQAAGRSYRLNQTHKHCKTYYLFYEGTMEQTAVQLMSRKQRAAKLLTGDIGLTGLDALTEGEGGFEEALLNAIGRDETLLDPSVLFKQNTEQSAIYADDAAYWNVEVGTTAEDVPEPITASPEIADDPLLVLAVQLGAVVHRIADGSPISRLPPAARKQETALPSPKVDPILERMLFNTNNLQFDFLAAFEPRSDELKQSHNRQTDEPESSPTIPIPPLTVPQSRKPDVDPDRIARREVFPEPKPEQLALF